LKKMGEMYEVVVFTASLSKVISSFFFLLHMHIKLASHFIKLVRRPCPRQARYPSSGFPQAVPRELLQSQRKLRQSQSDSCLVGAIVSTGASTRICHSWAVRLQTRLFWITLLLHTVSSWFNDPHDTELTDLVPFLADLSTVEDVRGILDGAR
jgi:RNA polymerase II subunit A small phosphatase-like protein